MGRPVILQSVTLLSIAWGSFFLHSCATSGRLVQDPVAFDRIVEAPRVQVGLSKAIRVGSATFRIEGGHLVHGSRALLDKAGAMAASAEIRPEGAGIRIGETVYAETRLRIVPATDGDLKVGAASYRGELLVLRDDDRETKAPRVTLINEVDLETYVKGVVGREMSLRKGAEALKAQVIAARSYAMYEVKARTLRLARGEHFDLYDDDRSQVYGGLDAETAYAAALVDQTRGLFVTWNGKLVKTFFSSTCGGRTEPAHIVLGREADDIPPLAGTICGDGKAAYCEKSKYFRWTATLAKDEIAKKLFPDKPATRISKVEITKTLPGGRAVEVALSIEGSSRKVPLAANEGFRRKISPQSIRSTLWDSIEEDAKQIVISGRGWGHACGLCQTGAYEMADRGFAAAEILEHYYPTAKVRKLY